MGKRKDPFDVERRMAFCRAKCQADFRGEVWQLTWEDWQTIWSNETIWQRRGRAATALCLTRRDPLLPWNMDNCCFLDRKTHLTIKNRRMHDIPVDDLWRRATHWSDYV